MVPKIVGLAGYSGSGKDEVADFAAQFGYQKKKVAGPIRDEFSAFLVEALVKAGENHQLPCTFENVVEAYRKSIYAKPTSPESRVGLQFWGTNFRRSIDIDYWTTSLEQSLADGGQYIISDVRDPVEIRLIKKLQGEVWWINRENLKPVGMPGHATENSLNPVDCDRVIENDGTLETLHDKIRFIFTFC